MTLDEYLKFVGAKFADGEMAKYRAELNQYILATVKDYSFDTLDTLKKAKKTLTYSNDKDFHEIIRDISKDLLENNRGTHLLTNGYRLEKHADEETGK